MVNIEGVSVVYREMSGGDPVIVPDAVSHPLRSWFGYQRPSYETQSYQLPFIAEDIKRTMWVDVGIVGFGLGGMDFVRHFLGTDIRSLLPAGMSALVAVGAIIKALWSEGHKHDAEMLYHNKAYLRSVIEDRSQKLQKTGFNPDTALFLAAAREATWQRMGKNYDGDEELFNSGFSSIIQWLVRFTNEDTSNIVQKLTPSQAIIFMETYLEYTDDTNPAHNSEASFGSEISTRFQARLRENLLASMEYIHQHSSS